MRRALGTAVLVLTLLALSSCDWTQVGFSGDNTFLNPVEPALTASAVSHLAVDWSVPCACLSGPPLVAGGVVYQLDGYTPTDDGTSPLSVRAFDAASGQVKWSRPLGLTAPTKQLAAVANGLVYVAVAGLSPQLVALDAQTGSVRWNVMPPAPGQGAVQSNTVPVVDGPLAFVDGLSSGGTSEISAIDAQGRVVWSAIPGGIVRALTTGDHTVYVASRVALTVFPYGIDLITGYNESDGKVKSVVAPPFDNFTPIDSLGFSNDLLYGTLTSGHDTLGGLTFAVHPDTGAIAWSTDRSSSRDFVAERGITGDAVITNHITGESTSANDAHTGALLWRDTVSAQVHGIAGDLVYLSEYDTVRILRVSDGALVTSFRLNPVLPPFEGIAAITPSGGRVYIAAEQHLYAFAPT